ncbi:lysophospholipid acyltransferase family protein [Sphingomonas sp.]|uniref:lysophospholipid acyltransferase family protein n=1 Tax=Sphingomonas sp. TaxID=28214 RepID=UPI003B3ACC6B
MAMIRTVAARAVARLIAGFARLVTGVVGDWRGCPPALNQRVYFANHSSHGDFVLIWTVLSVRARRQTRPVAAADYWNVPGLRRFIGAHVFNALLIDRKAGGGSAIAAMADALTQGDSLIIFPEGTRNTGTTPLLPLRPGIHHLARAWPAVEFVPVWIDNIARVMPKGELLPVPLLCSVIFGEPIALAPDETREEFLRRASQALLQLKPGEEPS